MFWENQACHSTRPFESLRVLSQVEGLMALSKIEGLVFDIMHSRLDFELALNVCVRRRGSAVNALKIFDRINWITRIFLGCNGLVQKDMGSLV